MVSVITRGELQYLAQLRLDDALLLLKDSRVSTAYYLAGCAVELALKACISKLIQPDTLPDKAFISAIESRKLEDLLAVSGLRFEMNADIRHQPQLGASWAIASNWSEDSHYQVWDSVTATNLVQAVGDKTHGVFQWVKKHW